MWDFSVSRAVGLMIKTAPFVLLRMIVYFGITIGFILTTGVGAGIGWGIGAFGDVDYQATAVAYGSIFGFAAAAGVLYFLREYILYMVKAGHIAVMVEAMDGNDIPFGRSQIELASEIVSERFVEANVLFAMDQLIKGVIRTITGLMQGLAAMIPVPALQNLVGVFKAFLKISLGFLDEVILAHAIRTKSDNPWESGQEALVYYAQNAKTIIKNAAFLAVIVYLLSFVIFLVMLAPAAVVVYVMPGAWSAGGIVFALVFAWAVKKSLLEPFAIACMMQVYFEAIEGQSPNPEWDAKLTKVSKKFAVMKEKATLWVAPKDGNTDFGRANF